MITHVVAGGVAVVRIERPERRNAMTLAMWRGLARLVRELSASPEARAIVLTGAGRDFCAGADVSEFDRVRGDAAQARAYEEAVDDCADAIFDSPRPTIAAIAGYCLGGGCHLALACDFRFVQPEARIGIPAARLSIVYGRRSTQRLLALAGLARAKHILFSAAQLDAAEAVAAGIADRLMPDALAAARSSAALFADNAPLSIAGAKAILNALAMGEGALPPGLAEQLIDAAAASADYLEGRRAFAEKRRPVFAGR